MRIVLAAAASAALTACVAAVPQPGPGGASGGSFRTGWTSLEPITDEFQVAWTVPALPTEPRMITVGRDRVIYRASLLPERLFVVDEAVRGGDGTVLAPAGTQFLLMDWPSLLVCSAGRYQTGLLGAGNKVCLLDEDGDRAPDTTFRGNDAYSGWFVMNRRMPAQRDPVQAVTLREVDPAQLANKPEFRLRVSHWPNERRGFYLSGEVSGETGFWTGCVDVRGPSDTPCFVPPILIGSHAQDGDQHRVTVRGVGRSAKLRFQLQYGTIAGAGVSGVRIFFDNDSAAATGR
jgi:hypothetical protein